ncbi:hypothetical protein D7026_12420 [Salinivibrio sp. VYel7]|nr:hypothetical protein [Salinivibrio sp. VYel7]
MLGEHSSVIKLSFPAEFDARSHLLSGYRGLQTVFLAVSCLSDNGRMFIPLFLCHLGGVYHSHPASRLRLTNLARLVDTFGSYDIHGWLLTKSLKVKR